MSMRFLPIKIPMVHLLNLLPWSEPRHLMEVYCKKVFFASLVEVALVHICPCQLVLEDFVAFHATRLSFFPLFNLIVLFFCVLLLLLVEQLLYLISAEIDAQLFQSNSIKHYFSIIVDFLQIFHNFHVLFSEEFILLGPCFSFLCGFQLLLVEAETKDQVDLAELQDDPSPHLLIHLESPIAKEKQVDANNDKEEKQLYLFRQDQLRSGGVEVH